MQLRITTRTNWHLKALELQSIEDLRKALGNGEMAKTKERLA
jgi:hypothetical protein